jgi:hypothetical protein
MTAIAYLEELEYIIVETRGNLFNVWLCGELVVSGIDHTELAAFAERVRLEKEGGEG